jgi:hypothetical protein
MIIGFTGTQQGMTDKQKKELTSLLVHLYGNYEYRIFIHGDCIGADAEAHDIAKGLGYLIAICPPDNSIKQANKVADIKFYPKPYLERNHSIVDKSNQMIACPQTKIEQLRSGTWATIRYARKSFKPLTIIDPF